MATERQTQTEATVTSADGTGLAIRRWPLAQPVLTLAVVHGLGDHGGRYERFASGMARFGMATCAVDLRGHGNSPGQRGHVNSWSEWVDDAAAFIADVAKQSGGGEVVPVGHSFGGAVVLSTVLAGKLSKTRRFVLSSPALKLKVEVPAWKASLGRLTAKIAPRLSMSNEVDPGTISRIPEIVEAYRNDPLVHDKISSRTFSEWQRAAGDSLARAGEIDIPFLILAGSDDRLIDPEGSRQLHEKASRMSTLRMLDGRYHEPFNDRDSDDVFQLIADWLRA